MIPIRELIQGKVKGHNWRLWIDSDGDFYLDKLCHNNLGQLGWVAEYAYFDVVMVLLRSFWTKELVWNTFTWPRPLSTVTASNKVYRLVILDEHGHFGIDRLSEDTLGEQFWESYCNFSNDDVIKTIFHTETIETVCAQTVLKLRRNRWKHD